MKYELEENIMIYGNVNNEFFERQAAILAKPISLALHYLKEHQKKLTTHEVGKFPIELGKVPMILQVIDQDTAPKDQIRPEIHRKYIDVQFLAAGGPEAAVYYDDDGTNAVAEDLIEPRDVLFYAPNPDAFEGTIQFTVGTYAVYLPWDIHIPAVQVGSSAAYIRKIVIKVPIESCI